MRCVPYWTRNPPAVGLAVVLDKKSKTQKFYFSLPYNGIAVNIYLASLMAKRWAEKGKEWADSPEADKFWGNLQCSAQKAFSEFKAKRKSPEHP